MIEIEATEERPEFNGTVNKREKTKTNSYQLWNFCHIHDFLGEEKEVHMFRLQRQKLRVEWGTSQAIAIQHLIEHEHQPHKSKE